MTDLLSLARNVHARLSAHKDAFEIIWRMPKPVTAAALADVEKKLGMKLPPPLRALYERGAGGVLLSWRVRRGHEERLDGDFDAPANGHLEIVSPSSLARRLASHGVVQITNDGGGNGYALRPDDARANVMWFDHDPVDGKHVRAAGVGRFDEWFTSWARIGFGSFGDDTDAVAKFLKTGKLTPIAEEEKPKKGGRAGGPIVEAPKHKEQVWAAAALPDGLRGATASNDGTIHVFDLATGAKLAKMAAKARVYVLCAHPKGELLISGGDQGFEVWNLKTGKPTKGSNTGMGKVLDMALTPDGKRLVTNGLGELACWDLATGKNVVRIEDDGDGCGVRVDAKGRAITYGEKTIRIWDLAKKRCVKKITHPKMPVAFSSRSLALDPRSGTIVIVDPKPALARWTTTGKCLTPPKSGGNARPHAALTPDGRTLLMNGSDVGVTLEAWDVETGKRTKTLSLKDRVGIASIAITPDGRRAVLGSAYGWVLVCDLDALA